MIRQLSALKRDRKGVSAVEFAMLAPLMFTLLLGTLDLGYDAYFRNLLKGVMDDAARQAAVGNMTGTQVDTYIKDRVSQLLPASSRNNSAAFTIQKKAFHNFSNVGQPEKITSDTNPLGTFNTGDCYQDANGNGAYDATGGASGLGGADDIVFYEVRAYFPRLFPTPSFLGWGNNMEIKASTIIRNQPYSQQNEPRIRCTS